MPKVSQHLWFEKDMKAALELYTALIPGSRIHFLSTMPADTPSGPSGSVTLAAFSLGSQDYKAIQGGPMAPFNQSFSIFVECDDQAEIDRLWEALSEGGTVEQCGWLKDRWGLSWQIVPKRLGELLGNPDRAMAKRVAEAMLGMRKLDIARLEAAGRSS
jgi:predicted 3-demethylubiquinone-9 3-methyltransferase (glyoxalase superfamily)